MSLFICIFYFLGGASIPATCLPLSSHSCLPAAIEFTENLDAAALPCPHFKNSAFADLHVQHTHSLAIAHKYLGMRVCDGAQL